MVCLSDEISVQATIKDNVAENDGPKEEFPVIINPSKSVDYLFSEVTSAFNYNPEQVEVVLVANDLSVILSEHRGKFLSQVGLNFNTISDVSIVINPVNSWQNIQVSDPASSEDELLLGASASPTAGDEGHSYKVQYNFPLNRNNVQQEAANEGEMPLLNKSMLSNDLPLLELPNNTVYVGLVNQAMTCYLNSLLQALYMTPEFRNALYNWEFDGQNESRSIPFQLQKLFLNLQTSTKSSVETTDLTTSFGWHGGEAWQQHDIQELCRVMFDALEQKFKQTKQANLISDLYEGKMLDYVRCLECDTEKSREDTFLDIPLPVRPFGSSIAYNSVEEALRAFVLPETLDGTNQYFCEKCNKKCDAHKGLKFTKFPYLLTLHLKRFDFDYNTMLRIKLNDKVVFPEILNLNSFIPKTNQEADTGEENNVKCDDSSTTDSGSALDDESCHAADSSAAAVNGQDLNCQEEDEGIDVGMASSSTENDRNRNREPEGPYKYELFSIMIHSGSASGGHYYAYIKDFQTNQWFCFNDQSVSRITEDDIKKTYGGGSLRGHYSGAYSPSTNAYMLMYRQINKERNCTAMTVDNFPPHIRRLLQHMKNKEEEDRLNREKENEMVKLKVYCYHPTQNRLVDTKIVTFIDAELDDIVKDVYDRLKLDGLVSLEDCRLVRYNKGKEDIHCSFDANVHRLCDIRPEHDVFNYDWMLDIKKPGTEFQEYKQGGVNVKVFLINLESEEVDGPVMLRVNVGDSVSDVKKNLSKILNKDMTAMKLVLEMYSNKPHYLDDDEAEFKFDSGCDGYKLYVAPALDEDPEKTFLMSKMHRIIDRFVHVVCINVILPEADLVTLETLSIPALDFNVVDRNDFCGGDRLTNSPNLRASPQPVGGSCSEGFGDQSNSEDSSLSDSDRTLVGDAPGDCIALLSSSSDSPQDQHMTSPSDPAEDTYNVEVFGSASAYEEMHWEDEETVESLQRCSKYYFRTTDVTSLNGGSGGRIEPDVQRCCRVLVDKRMTLARFKKHLEQLVGVPVEYFKVFRHYGTQEEEWSRLNDTLSFAKDGERLVVKLGRNLKKNECVGKVYHLVPDNISEPFSFLFEHIVAKGQTVGSVKKDIILKAKKQHMLDIPYNRSRLRKKNWKSPAKVYLDDQKFFDDISIINNFEMCIQELPEPEKVTSTNQLVLFVRRWCPSTYTLEPFSEVILDVPSVDELKRKLSEKSGIPQEFVEIMHSKTSFPCDMNVLTIHDLEWNPDVNQLENYTLQLYEDEQVFFYRDVREPLKELTREEKNEIHQRESTRLGQLSYRQCGLSRRERALVIYVDNSPNKSDNCGD